MVGAVPWGWHSGVGSCSGMYSIGEVVNFLLCDRLATLEGEAHGGLRERPAPSANDDFLWVKGNEHELHFVDLLRSRGMAVAEVPPTEAIRNSTAAVAATEAAMRS